MGGLSEYWGNMARRARGAGLGRRAWQPPRSGAGSAEGPVCGFVGLGLEGHAQEDFKPELKQCPLSSSQASALEVSHP